MYLLPGVRWADPGVLEADEALLVEDRGLEGVLKMLPGVPHFWRDGVEGSWKGSVEFIWLDIVNVSLASIFYFFDFKI